jgi:tRNA-splicing ligase RtcB (3'-phosphate/5'-hydroxy nucleic acid ligase)
MDKENTMSFETLTDRSGIYTRVPIKMWTHGVPVEDVAMKQLANLATLPFIHDHIAVMPDVHWGMGATVGSVIATKNAIVPAAVGVDIGCGMAAVRLAGARAEHLPDSLAQMRSEVEQAVPAGFNVHGAGDQNARGVNRLLERLVPWLEEKHPKVTERRKNPVAEIIDSQFGTLGGGNHFIEVCIDENDDLWVMLHSGSRGIGNAIGQYFIAQAREEMVRLDIHLPDRDLAYFNEGTTGFDDYVHAVGWAQDYAAANRAEMLRRILIVLRRHLPPFCEQDETVACHHNYVARENHFGADVWVTRKGAVRAGAGEMGIIPGSMGARSYIVRGKGNTDSFCSCSHGAGRKMSRGEAKRTFSLEDHVLATEGVECRKDQGVVDETPGAYKNIDDVMAAQSDLVEVAHELRQVLCVKG